MRGGKESAPHAVSGLTEPPNSIRSSGRIRTERRRESLLRAYRKIVAST